MAQVVGRERVQAQVRWEKDMGRGIKWEIAVVVAGSSTLTVLKLQEVILNWTWHTRKLVKVFADRTDLVKDTTIEEVLEKMKENYSNSVLHCRTGNEGLSPSVAVYGLC